MTDTQRIIRLIREIGQEQIPENIRITIKNCVLDYIGVCLAGAYELKDKLNRYLDLKPFQSEEASVIGLNRKCSVEDAALLNGIASHYYELDDGSRFGMVHIGAPVLSALFALSDSFSITSDRFLHAILVGYEITIRLAAAIQPGHKKKGFHATGTCGCIGAAAAIATALDYDERSLENTIAAAAASASGLLEMIEDVSQLKPFNAGKAAQNALTAAMIGKSGFSGPLDPIGGKRGFIQDLAESFSEVWFDRKNSVKYAILGIYRKPYASCRHCHSAVEAALFLRNEIKPEEIESIQVYTYGLAVFGHDHTDIPSIGAAKMSIPFSVAAAIILNTGGMDSMKPQTVKDERILQLAKKVHVTEKEEYSLQVPKKRIADVHIFLTSGGTVSKRVDYPKGEPENPMSNEEIELKFRQMAIHAGRDEIYCSKVIEYSQSPDISLKELVTIII